jgi:hypothetical protein
MELAWEERSLLRERRLGVPEVYDELCSRVGGWARPDDLGCSFDLNFPFALNVVEGFPLASCIGGNGLMNSGDVGLTGLVGTDCCCMSD